MIEQLQQTIIGPDGKPGPDWRIDPAKYVLACKLTGTLDKDINSILTFYRATSAAKDGDDVARLLHAVNESIGGYAVESLDNWITYGPILIPSTANGIGTLRKIRNRAKSAIFGNDNLKAIVDADGKLGQLLAALDKLEGSAILQGYRNATQPINDPDYRGIRLELDLNLGTLPSGSRLPKQLLVPALLGREIDGDEVEKIRDSMGACVDGFSEFLNRHGITHDTDGNYQCESCGQLDEDMESTEILNCEKFTLTQSILDDLDDDQRDEILTALGDDSDASDNWADLLESKSDDEIRKLLFPEAKEKDKEQEGIEYNAAVYTFKPDFEQIDGLDVLGFAELARILPILQSVDDAYRAQGILPPIPGTLRKASITHYDRKGDSTWAWSPDEARLAHKIASAGIIVGVNVLHGNITLSYGEHVQTVNRTDTIPGKSVVEISEVHCGDDAELWVGIAQARLTI